MEKQSKPNKGDKEIKLKWPITLNALQKALVKLNIAKTARVFLEDKTGGIGTKSSFEHSQASEVVLKANLINATGKATELIISGTDFN